MHNKTIIYRAVVAVIFNFFAILTIAQTNFYKHMEGRIADGIHMKADLVRIDNKISGYYYYFYVDTLKQMDFGMHYGKSMPLTGFINDDNSLAFKEFAADMAGSSFQGKLEDGVIAGDWVSSDGTKTLPFELTETYPEGTIAFYVYHLKDSGPLLEGKTSPAAAIDLTLLLPKPYASAAPVDSVNAVIYSEFFGLDSAKGDPQQMLRESRDKFFRNYRKANTEIYQEGATSFNWEKTKAVKIQYNEKQILSMEFYDYGYTGGAHGLSLSRFVVISLDDGQRITLDGIFREDYQNDLRDIVNAQVRLQYDLPRESDLRNAGFFVENVDLSDNFYLNKDGIGFYYNQYEIAPFAMGPVDIFVPYYKMKRIMDPDGALYILIGK